MNDEKIRGISGTHPIEMMPPQRIEITLAEALRIEANPGAKIGPLIGDLDYRRDILPLLIKSGAVVGERQPTPSRRP